MSFYFEELFKLRNEENKVQENKVARIMEAPLRLAIYGSEGLSAAPIIDSNTRILAAERHKMTLLDPTSKESRNMAKELKKLEKQRSLNSAINRLSVSAPLFPSWWVDKMSPGFRSLYEGYLTKIPAQYNLRLGSSQKQDASNLNFNFLDNFTKAPACQSLAGSIDPYAFMQRVMSLCKQGSTLTSNCYDVAGVLAFIQQLPVLPDMASIIHNVFVRSNIYNDDLHFSGNDYDNNSEDTAAITRLGVQVVSMPYIYKMISSALTQTWQEEVAERVFLGCIDILSLIIKYSSFSCINKLEFAKCCSVLLGNSATPKPSMKTLLRSSSLIASMAISGGENELNINGIQKKIIELITMFVSSSVIESENTSDNDEMDEEYDNDNIDKGGDEENENGTESNIEREAESKKKWNYKLMLQENSNPIILSLREKKLTMFEYYSSIIDFLMLTFIKCKFSRHGLEHISPKSVSSEQLKVSKSLANAYEIAAEAAIMASEQNVQLLTTNVDQTSYCIAVEASAANNKSTDFDSNSLTEGLKQEHEKILGDGDIDSEKEDDEIERALNMENRENTIKFKKLAELMKIKTKKFSKLIKGTKGQASEFIAIFYKNYQPISQDL